MLAETLKPAFDRFNLTACPRATLQAPQSVSAEARAPDRVELQLSCVMLGTVRELVKQQENYKPEDFRESLQHAPSPDSLMDFCFSYRSSEAENLNTYPEIGLQGRASTFMPGEDANPTHPLERTCSENCHLCNMCRCDSGLSGGMAPEISS